MLRSGALSTMRKTVWRDAQSVKFEVIVVKCGLVVL